MKDQLKLSGLVYLLLAVFIVNGAQKAIAQSAAPVQGQGKFRIDVQVEDKRGTLVHDLKAGDVTLLVDKQPVKLDEFRVVENTVVKSFDPANPNAEAKTSMEPEEIVLVLDAVNIPMQPVDLIREQLKRYFRSNGGRLAAPTRLVLFRSTAMQIGSQATLDGNGLASTLEKLDPMMRSERSSQAEYGDLERYEKSLKNFIQLAQYESKMPGRKVILWLGPGWPLIQNSRLQFNADYQKQNFDTVVAMLNELRENRLTVYSVRVDADNRQNNILFEAFTKPVKKKKDVDSANLAVQVLAVESGGRVTDPDNEMATQIGHAIEEVQSYYSLSFAPVVSGQAGTYHSIEVKVNRPDVKVRTVTGYYE